VRHQNRPRSRGRDSLKLGRHPPRFSVHPESRRKGRPSKIVRIRADLRMPCEFSEFQCNSSYVGGFPTDCYFSTVGFCDGLKRVPWKDKEQHPTRHASGEDICITFSQSPPHCGAFCLTDHRIDSCVITLGRADTLASFWPETHFFPDSWSAFFWALFASLRRMHRLNRSQMESLSRMIGM